MINMKRKILGGVLLCFCCLINICNLYSQNHTSSLGKYYEGDLYLVNNNIKSPVQPLMGSCLTPDGPMLVISAADQSVNGSNFTYLENNNYCTQTDQINTVTVCFTFNPSSSSVLIDGIVRFTQCCSSFFGCNCVNGFTQAELFDNTCTSIGNGFMYSGLDTNITYTFCYSYFVGCFDNLTGGFSDCGSTVEDICLYYLDIVPLSIENEGDTINNGNNDSLNMKQDTDLVLYPNPTGKILNLDKRYQQVRLFSANGYVLQSYQNVRTLNLSNYSEGVYYIQLGKFGRPKKLFITN